MQNLDLIKEQLLETIFSQATFSDVKGGLNWYDDAHKFTKQVAAIYGIEHFKVAAILSCLSPRNNWDRNQIDLINFLEHGLDAKFCTYGNQVLKCFWILSAESVSEVLEILGGDKTKAFFKNIWDREALDVTIDVWMIRVLGIEGSLTSKKYRDSERAVQNFAAKKGLKPSEIQAILWETIRNQSKKVA